MPCAFEGDEKMDDYYLIKHPELFINDIINKMAQNDPTKYKQIALENTMCDYMEWQARKMRDFAIEKAQMDKSNPDNNDSNSTMMSRDEFADFVAKGGFGE